MTNQIEFTKMHGAGNDYIYINMMKYPVSRPETLAVQWSKFHTGIGSDGLVLIDRSDRADFSMRIFNADGSEAMMCGNAARCIGKYVYENGLTRKDVITLETLSGIKELKLSIRKDKVTEVTVDMGSPAVLNKDIEVKTDMGIFQGTYISMGNPHLVIFTDDAEAVELEKVGPLIEHHSLFPDRTNVEFGQVLPDNKLRMRVWERGSGITQACGTGACATAVAAILTGNADGVFTVQMDGGALTIEWDRGKNKVFMTGDATTVFKGMIDL